MATEIKRETCTPTGFAEPRPIGQPFGQWLTNPLLDRVVAIIAVAPFAYPIVMHFRMYFKLGELIYLMQTLLLVGTVIVRRPAVRITTDPLYWFWAFLATYWGLLTLSFEQPGRALISARVVLLLSILNFALMVWARLSLGKNVGLLPAQREIVEEGAYRWARHPIYSAYFLGTAVAALESYSPRNLLIYALGIIWFVLRSLAEEDFLRKDPTYLSYMRRVPWRWIPGVI